MELIERNTGTISHKNKAIDRIATTLAKILPPPDPDLQLVVIIPAKDEAETIENILLAHINQQTRDHTILSKRLYEIIVLCHNCTDTTLLKCRQFAKSNPETKIHVLVLESKIADNVGGARRVLMNIAASRLKSRNGIIASTDADTVPDTHWIATLLAYSDKNVDLVCGLIKVDYSVMNGQPLKYLLAKDNYLMLQAKLESELLPDPENPWPRHYYNWGPNVAIKKHVYKSVGGINPLSFLEDVDLFNRVVEQGFKVRHCMEAMVTTSVRINSRCVEGFGAELKVWSENEGIPYRVEGLEKLRSRFEIYGLIKSYYEKPSLKTFNKIAKLSHIEPEQLALLSAKFRRYEAMMIYMKQHLSSCPVWNSIHPNICVLEACHQLESHLKIKPEMFSC